MKALHIECGGKGCGICNAGFKPVTIPEGDWYTLKCKLCGFENGGRIVNEELPLTAPDIGCVMCRADKTHVEYVKLALLRNAVCTCCGEVRSICKCRWTWCYKCNKCSGCCNHSGKDHK